MPDRRPNALGRTLAAQMSILGSVLAAMWCLELADQLLLQGWLDRFGIVPRSWLGLRGIVLAPFLHGSLAHLAANTVPLAVLGWLVMLPRTSDFWLVSAAAALVGGAGTLLLGAPQTVHLGASTLIFGYLGFLLLRGYFQRNALSIVLSLGVAALYGSALLGVLPLQPGVSWQSHLFGFLGGALTARART
ncbi:MAG: rhomboid family intramembrane serine protease [Cyanobacteria bacterium QS_8_64_29]|nr:MAG: rhomboid family intramembrane serine protease [Cyanobacteria bacterium QS_8_64_29]